MTANCCDFNRSTQHLNSNDREEGVKKDIGASKSYLTGNKRTNTHLYFRHQTACSCQYLDREPAGLLGIEFRVYVVRTFWTDRTLV